MEQNIVTETVRRIVSGTSPRWLWILGLVFFVFGLACAIQIHENGKSFFLGRADTWDSTKAALLVLLVSLCFLAITVRRANAIVVPRRFLWTLIVPFFWVFWFPILALTPCQSAGNNEPFTELVKSSKTFARWILTRFVLPFTALGIAAFLLTCTHSVRMSDDFFTRFPAFTVTSARLVLQGTCTLGDFRYMGGWAKAQGKDRERPIYFTYCGVYDSIKGRIYLNARTLITYR